MAMNSSPNQDDEIMAEINMTPLIDIMLVLIIIFMVTSTVSSDSGLDINLATSKQGKSLQQKEEVRPLIISMDKHGNIALDGAKVQFDDLKVAIATNLEKLGTTTVVFEGDKEAMLGQAVSIMDMAKEAGATKFAVATQTE